MAVEEVSGRISGERRRQHLTQAELGARIGLSPAALSRLEKGSIQPQIRVIKVAAECLGVSVGYLLEAQPLVFMVASLGDFNYSGQVNHIRNLVEVGLSHQPGLVGVWQTAEYPPRHLTTTWYADPEMMGRVINRMKILRGVERVSAFFNLGQPVMIGKGEVSVDRMVGLQFDGDPFDMLTRLESVPVPENIAASVHRVTGGYDLFMQTSTEGWDYFGPFVYDYGAKIDVWSLERIPMG